MGGCRCSYKTCKSATKTHQELHFFHYPVKTRDRCMQWILNADRMEFSYLPNDQLRNKVVCGLHFQESCFTNELRKRLVHDAVPTLDVGCDAELDPPLPEKIEVFSEADDYTNMELEGDGERSSDGRVATITATSGDGTTFSLDTLPYDIPQKPHLVTYNFVDGSLVPSVSIHETTTESSQNGNTVSEDQVVQPYEDYTSIFVAGDPSIQYITDPVAPIATSPPRSIYPDTNTITISPNEPRMDSFVTDFIQDPLASDEQANSSDVECIIEDMDASNTRETHIISSGDHGFVTDTADDGDNAVVMVRVEEVIPDNTHRHHHRQQQLQKRQKVTAMIDISGDDDDDNDDNDTDQMDDEEDDDGDAVIVSSKSLSDGNVEMQVLMAPLRAPIAMPLRTQPPLHMLPTLVHRPIVPAKVRRAVSMPRTKSKVKIQQNDIILPQAATSSTHIRDTALQQQEQQQRSQLQRPQSQQHRPQPQQQRPQPRQQRLQPQQERPQLHQQRPQLQQTRPQLQQPRPQLPQPRPQMQQQRPQLHQQTPSPPLQSKQPSMAKQSYTYITTAQPRYLSTMPPVPVLDNRRITTLPTSSPANKAVAIPQRTTAVIKSAILPRPILRPRIQQIIPGIIRNTQNVIPPPCPNPVTSIPNLIGGNNNNNNNNKTTRTRDVSANLAALRPELPPSLYSAIAIHLQKKRGFFDAAETEFLTKLYTSTPKGYTTLRSLGWELPGEDVVKELLEMKDN